MAVSVQDGEGFVDLPGLVEQVNGDAQVALAVRDVDAGLGELALALLAVVGRGGAADGGQDDQGGPGRALAGLTSRYRSGSSPATNQSTSLASHPAMAPMPASRNSSRDAIQGSVVAKLAGQKTSKARTPRSSRTVIRASGQAPVPPPSPASRPAAGAAGQAGPDAA